MHHYSLLAWEIFAGAFLAGFIASLVFNLEDGWKVGLPIRAAVWIFQFAIVFLISVFAGFWNTLETFAQATQPFVGLSPEDGGTATDTLLLDYIGLPPMISTYVAFQNSHWKVMVSTIMALVNRLLPIIATGCVSIREEEVSTGVWTTIIYFNKPWVICSIVFLGVYVVLMPGMVLSGEHHRHLPRQCLCIADTISWLYSSSIARSDVFETLRENKGGRDIGGYLEDRDKVIARLTLEEERYIFGRIKNDDDGGNDAATSDVTYHLGIDVKRDDGQYVEPPPTHLERAKAIWPWGRTRRRIRHRKLKSGDDGDERDVTGATFAQNTTGRAEIEHDSEADDE